MPNVQRREADKCNVLGLLELTHTPCSFVVPGGQRYCATIQMISLVARQTPKLTRPITSAGCFLLRQWIHQNRVLKCVLLEYQLRMCYAQVNLGFFWMGWTSYRQISFWASIMSGSFVGCGVVLVLVRIRFSDVHLRRAGSDRFASHH